MVILEIIHGNISKDMHVGGRRTYLLRNIYNVVEARGRRKNRSYGPSIRGCIQPALTEMISAFPET